MTKLRELVEKTRSVRRFREDTPVASDTLQELVDIARLIPSRNNAQPLRYLPSTSSESNKGIFETLVWYAEACVRKKMLTES